MVQLALLALMEQLVKLARKGLKARQAPKALKVLVVHRIQSRRVRDLLVEQLLHREQLR